MMAILYLLLGLVPPLFAGPLAGLAYINILKHGKRWYLIPFWLLLLLVNLLVMDWVVSSARQWFSISSLAACLFTPVASILTILVMRSAWRRLADTRAGDPAGNRWFPLGFVLIPSLQIIIFGAVIISAPLLCKLGWLVCQDL
jgi:hypothetical protein